MLGTMSEKHVLCMQLFYVFTIMLFVMAESCILRTLFSLFNGAQHTSGIISVIGSFALGQKI